jgi:hypothetical protein
MTEPAPDRPRRSVPLNFALGMIVLAALLFGMTATHVSPPGSSEGGLPTLALLVSAFAFWFNWARITMAIMLPLLTLLWLPLALQALGDLQDNDVNPIVYVFLATGLTVAGLVMVFTPSSNEYYLLTRQRRQNRRAGRRAKGRVQL